MLPPPDKDAPFFDPVRVCFAVPEFAGFHIGGIATSYFRFADALAGSGHDVTVLLTAPSGVTPEQAAALVETCALRNIRVLTPPDLPFRCEGSEEVLWAYRAWYWLRDQSFDVIHFTDWKAAGYFCVAGKRCGMAFANTLLCVSTRGSSRWIRDANQTLPGHHDELSLEFIERRTVEMADVLFLPSEYMETWMQEQGWRIPRRSYRVRNLTRWPERLPRSSPQPDHAIGEIVFFGRLEPRKGVRLFCDALDRLNHGGLEGRKITFLGAHTRVGDFDSRNFLRERMGKWRCEVAILPDHSREEALAYLSRPEVLAVMPSRLDNSPNTFLECLLGNVRCLAANTSGFPELLAKEDRERMLFDFTAAALAEKIETVLGSPPALGTLSYDPAESEREWIGWHNALGAHTRPLPAVPASAPLLPKVSVCMTHFNQPAFLRQAVASLESQTYKNLEVILVDDGSTHPEATRTLDELEERFASRGWKLIRQTNRYVSAARNTAARAASGEYLMFMDDDNVAKASEVETFVSSAISSGARLLVCSIDCFQEDGLPPQEHTSSTYRYLFLGGPPAAGLFANSIGDANFLIDPALFWELGGFTERRGTAEDVSFLANALLRGHDILTVPDAMYWYRARPDSMSRNPNHNYHQDVLSTYRHYVHPELRDVLGYAVQLHGDRYKQVRRFERKLTHYWTVADNACEALGIQSYFDCGWHGDEQTHRWTGRDGQSATITINNPADELPIDFLVLAVPLRERDSLSVRFNGELLLAGHRTGRLVLRELALKQGWNELTFASALSPEAPGEVDRRALSYRFSEIVMRPARGDSVDGKSAPMAFATLQSDGESGVTVLFGGGWHADERTHRWTGSRGRQASLLFCGLPGGLAAVDFSARVQFHQADDAFRVYWNGQLIADGVASTTITLKSLKLSWPENVLLFEAQLEPMSPGPDDARLLGCCFSDMRVVPSRLQ